MSDQVATSGHSGDQFGPPSKSRPTSKAEVREQAREIVRKDARLGKFNWKPEDLVWAFGDSDEARSELQALEAQADAAAAEKREAQRRSHASGLVRGRAELIVQRWHKERDEAELALAITQARRELGLDAPQKEA